MFCQVDKWLQFFFWKIVCLHTLSWKAGSSLLRIAYFFRYNRLKNQGFWEKYICLMAQQLHCWHNFERYNHCSKKASSECIMTSFQLCTQWSIDFEMNYAIYTRNINHHHRPISLLSNFLICGMLILISKNADLERFAFPFAWSGWDNLIACCFSVIPSADVSSQNVGKSLWWKSNTITCKYNVESWEHHKKPKFRILGDFYNQSNVCMPPSMIFKFIFSYVFYKVSHSGAMCNRLLNSY